eukprot:322065-Rhodomonas_salina.1
MDSIMFQREQITAGLNQRGRETLEHCRSFPYSDPWHRLTQSKVATIRPRFCKVVSNDCDQRRKLVICHGRLEAQRKAVCVVLVLQLIHLVGPAAVVVEYVYHDRHGGRWRDALQHC